jgi:hypothetical protein
MRRALDAGRYPNALRIVEANRAAGGTDEELAMMPMEEGRSERLLDGVEVELERRAAASRAGG